MGIGNLGDLKSPRKKWRWLIEFINDGVSAGEPKFVKINSRPLEEIEFINNLEKPRNEFGFYNLWLPKGSALAPFNEVVLKLIDSNDIPLEKWTLKEAKLLKLENEALDDEEVFAGTITHTDVKYQNLT